MAKALDIVIGDMHVGNMLAVAYPDPDQERLKLNAAQRWMWKLWRDNFLPDLERLIRQHEPDHTHLLLGGDLIDLDAKRRTEMQWTRMKEDAVENAIKLLEPIAEWCDSIHVIRGTRSHTGLESRGDELIGRNFDNVVWRTKKFASWYRVDYKLAGVHAHARHLGKNRSKWAKENVLAASREEIKLELLDDHLQNGTKLDIPHIVYGFHYHYYDATPPHKQPIVVQVPSWQLSENSEYIAEIDPIGRINPVGGVVSVYENGRVVAQEPLLYRPPSKL